MNYVRNSLAGGERLVHIGRFHWLYTFKACMSIVWGFVFAAVIIGGAIFVQIKTNIVLDRPFLPDDPWYMYVLKLHAGVKLAALLMIVTSIISFAHRMVIRATTEVAVTSRRVVYKRGLFARYVGEISIDRIEGVNVFQSVMGRFFDFGHVIIRGMGVGEVILPPIINPIKFRRAIEYARTLEDKKL